MQRLDNKTFRSLLDGEDRPTLVLGAGVSQPLLPLAATLKTAIVYNALRRAEEKGEENNPPWKRLRAALGQPHLTLELLCSMFLYRCMEPDASEPTEMLHAVCNIPTGTTHPYSAYLSFLAGQGRLGPILTTNFDTLLTSAIDAANVITDPQLRYRTLKDCTLRPAAEGEICALHGTFHAFKPSDRTADPVYAPPSSITARGLAQPFGQELDAYICSALTSRPVLFIGYSGGDHYDVNPILLRLRDTTGANNWFWLCHSGNKHRDVSEVIWRAFSDRLFSAKADRLLYEYCKNNGAEVPSPHQPDDDSWKARLSQFFDSLSTSGSQFNAFLHDVATNFHGAWLTTEHYYLTSVGLDDRYAFHMAGVPLLKERSLWAERKIRRILRFRGQPHFATLFLAQYMYRREANRLWAAYKKRSSFVEEGASPARGLVTKVTVQLLPALVYGFLAEQVLFRLTQRLLKRAWRQFEKHSRRAMPSRPEDRAMEVVGKAVVENYLGLICSDRSLALKRLLNGQTIMGHAIRRRQVVSEAIRQMVEQHRMAAFAHYDKCVQLCKGADEILKDMGNVVGCIGELIPSAIWQMIANENRARDTPLPERADALKICLEHRKDRIEAERDAARSAGAAHAEYLLAELPQTWLRASELLKAVFEIEEDADLPPPWSTLTPNKRKDALAALTVCEEKFNEYHESARYNRLYPAYYESRLIMAISKGDEERANAVLHEVKEYKRRQYGDQPWPEAMLRRRIFDRHERWLEAHRGGASGPSRRSDSSLARDSFRQSYAR